MNPDGCGADAVYFPGDSDDFIISDGGDGGDAGVPVQCLMSHNGNKGCGEWSDNLHDISAPSCSSDVCACGNRLLSRDFSSTGYRLYLGQVVYFFRNGRNSIMTKGIVSHLSDSSNIDVTDGKDRTVTVKYFEKAFSHDKYDELHAQSDVHISSEAADSGKGRRTRQPLIVAVKKVRAAVIEAPVCPPTPPSPCSETSTSPSSCPSTSPSTATSSSSSSNTTAKRAANSPGQQVEKKGKTSSGSSAAVQLANKQESKSPAKQVKQEKAIEKATKGFSRQSISAAVSSSSCAHSPRFDYCSVHDLADSLFPPAICGFNSVRGVDRQIKRGLLHALYQHLKPPSRDSDDFGQGSAIMTVDQLQELINECPTSIEQMRNTGMMPLCAALLDDQVSPQCASLSLSSGSDPILSLGAEVIVVMRTYLSERGFDVESLGVTDRLPGLGRGREGEGEGKGEYQREGRRTLPRGLSIPLSYEHFETALDLAFERLDGRENFENAKGVKGLDYIANDSATSSTKGSKMTAMYGAMNPPFIEEAVVQTSRVGRSDDFLDIGSGIGQVVLQVAATVGCKSTGMEISQPRHDAAVKLLAALEAVLEEAGIISDDTHPTLRSLVDLKLMDFCSTQGGEIVTVATVTFFNNFGPWFDPLVARFSDQLTSKRKGFQVIVLNALIEAQKWLHMTEFMGGQEACTWSRKDMPVYHYTMLTDVPMWRCKPCFLDNFLGIDDCENCGRSVKTARNGGSISMR